MEEVPTKRGRARLLTRLELAAEREWPGMFDGFGKDARFYELIDETIAGGFEFRYLALEDHEGRVRAIQPLFWVDQDVLAASAAARYVKAIRAVWPRFFKLRMLMVGCAAGEGRIADGAWAAEALHDALDVLRTDAALIILKDFPHSCREALRPFSENGYARIASMPMTRLPLTFSSFEEYMETRLSKVMRKNLRRKFRAAQGITMEVLHDVTPIVDEVYPLYLQVHEKAALKFEKLTPEFLCSLGQRMPDRARFFIWRLEGRAVAFSVCMVHGDGIHDDYLGLDYAVALERSLYFVTFRDIITWALANGLKSYHSSPLNYDPKLHLRCELAPLDLYVKATARPLNWLCKGLLRFVQPTRSQPVLRRFPNAHEL